MTPSDDARLEVLHVHYSETFSIIGAQVRTRDRLVLAVLASLALLAIDTWLPQQLGIVVGGVAREKFGVGATFGPGLLTAVLWSLFTVSVIRYFQSCVYLERLYRYVHALESDLSRFFSGVPFTREGEFYLKKYPWYSTVISTVYSFALPIGVVVAVVLKLLDEFSNVASVPALIVDTSLGSIIVTASILYLVHVVFTR
ncbi:hypothetical protein [Catellatospora sp. NPDC049133]|uniref:hypothetical protein n=1 Tax=Catellatospora sp. NPDC049133 TaxID=3155499 RepID=UPI0033EEE7F6